MGIYTRITRVTRVMINADAPDPELEAELQADNDQVKLVTASKGSNHSWIILVVAIVLAGAAVAVWRGTKSKGPDRAPPHKVEELSTSAHPKVPASPEDSDGVSASAETE